jgi:ankyrin repeat protein
MLNPEFAQVGWRPDPTSLFKCSITREATKFTYLMALVMSGRDALTQALARQAELDILLASPDSVSICMQTNSEGWTALMLAARNSNGDSTEATVAQLLAHESSGQVARMQSTLGFTALMLAATHSNARSTPATVAQLLAHESSGQVARMQNKFGVTALILISPRTNTSSNDATLAQLLSHESSGQVARMKCNDGHTALLYAAAFSKPTGSDAVAMIAPYADADDIEHALFAYPRAFHAYTRRLHQRMQERDTLSTALRQGLSLVEATTLLYL